MALVYNGTPDNATQYQNRVTANTYGASPYASAGGSTEVELTGTTANAVGYWTRDGVSAGNKIDVGRRTAVVYTNSNWASSTAVKDIHGQVTSGGAKTTNTLLKTTGGSATSQDDNWDAWADTRGGTANNNTHNTTSYK